MILFCKAVDLPFQFIIRLNQCIFRFFFQFFRFALNNGCIIAHIQQGIQLGKAGTFIAQFLLLEERLLQFFLCIGKLFCKLFQTAMQSVQVLWQSRNYILEANHVAGSIITQFCRVRCLANKVGMEYLFQRFIFDCDFKACIVTYRHRFRCPHCCTDKPQQRLTCILALIVMLSPKVDAHESKLSKPSFSNKPLCR